MTNCEKCLWDGQGGCTNSEDDIGDLDCKGFAAVPELRPEDMYKLLFMLMYNLGGQIDICKDEIDRWDDNQTVDIGYDRESGRFTLTTNPLPPEPSKIIVNGLIIPRVN